MARKERKKSVKEQFSANPFKDLKGFVVEKEQKKQPAQDAPVPRCELQPKGEPDDEGLFARQMEALGVKTLAGDERVAPREPIASTEKAPQRTAAPRTEEELFLQELGRMDVTFCDCHPESEVAFPTASPRRMKQLRRGTLSPEARLDLHGLGREEALARVAHFLQDCVYQGKKTALIITGRGVGSQQGPVLRPAVESYLSAGGRRWISEWGRAPKQYGGEGALVVFIKNQGYGPG